MPNFRSMNQFLCLFQIISLKNKSNLLKSFSFILNEQELCSKPWQPLLAGRSNNHMSRTAGESFPQGWIPTISIHMNGPRTSHQVGIQQSKERARRCSSSFGLYHGQRRSPVETHRKSLLQEEGSRAGRSLTPSRPMTASIPLEFTEKVFCIKSWHNSLELCSSSRLTVLPIGSSQKESFTSSISKCLTDLFSKPGWGHVLH